MKPFKSETAAFIVLSSFTFVACGVEPSAAEVPFATRRNALTENGSDESIKVSPEATQPQAKEADSKEAIQVTGEPALPSTQPGKDGDASSAPVSGELTIYQPPPPPPPPPAAHARYRAYITGFAVNRETRDSLGEIDGKRDEVFLDYVVQAADAAYHPQGPMSHDRTLIIGDTWRLDGRHLGGTASDMGGLRTGDRYPNPDPALRLPRRPADALPLQIWAGELIDGENGVVVMPSIWEWDDYTSRVAEDWGVALVRLIPTLVGAAGTIAGNPAVVGVGTALRTLEPLVEAPLGSLFGHAATRPIGMTRVGDSGTYVFRPQTLELNYQSAEHIIRDGLNSGRPGVVRLDFVEDDYLAGDYTLYLVIERD